MKKKNLQNHGGAKTYPGMGNQYVLTFKRPCFTNSQLKELIEIVDSKAQVASLISTKDPYAASKLRRSSVVFLEKKDYPWLYKILWGVAKEANTTYGYDIKAYQGPVQIAVYDANNEGFFDWHTDVVPSDMSRKISLSIPLNNQSEYQGGAFEVREGNIERAIPQTAGIPVSFPGWLPHRVTPVTAGKRYSMVAWILGPYWR